MTGEGGPKAGGEKPPTSVDEAAARLARLLGEEPIPDEPAPPVATAADEPEATSLPEGVAEVTENGEEIVEAEWEPASDLEPGIFAAPLGQTPPPPEAAPPEAATSEDAPAEADMPGDEGDPSDAGAPEPESPEAESPEPAVASASEPPAPDVDSGPGPEPDTGPAMAAAAPVPPPLMPRVPRPPRPAPELSAEPDALRPATPPVPPEPDGLEPAERPSPEPAGMAPKPAPTAGKAPAVIEARHLSLTFTTRDGPVQALADVNIAIGAGEFVSLIGPSGCGKTTLLRVIADLEQPTAGDITVNGTTAAEARQARGYGYVFQAPALYPWRNIARNVGLPLEIMGLGAVERERRVASNLDLVNLTGFEKKYPWQLSGGMQQRVSIARALAVESDLLLMDEPFGALDEIVRDHLNEQLHELWRTTKKTVVFVTHSIPEAVFLSTRIVVMTPRPGKIHDIIESPLPAARSLDIRDTPEFLEVAHRVREGLKAGHAYED